MKSLSFKYGIMAVFFIFVHAAPLLAQSIWTDSGAKKNISIEFILPSITNSIVGKTTNQTNIFAMRLPIGESKHLVVELPYSSGKIEGLSSYSWSSFSYYRNSYNYCCGSYHDKKSGGSIGNLYLGLEKLNETNNTFFEFGIRLPTSSEEEIVSNILGVLADIERFDAFIVDYIVLKSALNFSPRLSNSVTCRFRAAPSFWINLEKDYNRDSNELLFNTSGQIWFDNGELSLGGGLSIISIITEEALIFNNKSSFQLGMSASYTINNIKPGFFIRFPLDDDLKDLVSHVFGLNIQWLIR